MGTCLCLDTDHTPKEKKNFSPLVFFHNKQSKSSVISNRVGVGGVGGVGGISMSLNMSIRTLPREYYKFFAKKLPEKSEIISSEYVCPFSHGLLKKDFVKIWGPVTSQGALSQRRLGLIEYMPNQFVPVSVKITEGQITDEIIKDSMVCQKFKNRYLLKMYGYLQNDEMGKVMRVYEYIYGGNLRTMKKNLKEIEKYQILIKVCKGMIALNKKELVHGGLSTRKILISKCLKNVKISGFESSCMFDSGKDSNLKFSVDGDPEFCSPEKYLKLDLTKENLHLIDIYSFGIILWETFSNEIPFLDLKKRQFGNLNQEIFFQKLYPEISKIKNENLGELITSCWDEKTENRPQSWEEVKSELENCLNENCKKLLNT